MKTLRIIFSAFLPLALSLIFLEACGAPASRQLLSVTISPASANASGSTDGQVQFIATGHYSSEPFTVTPLQASWGASAFPQKIATVTQAGLATCAQGVSGETTVEAWVQLVTNPMCDSIDSAGRPGCGNVGAMANLTCP